MIRLAGILTFLFASINFNAQLLSNNLGMFDDSVKRFFSLEGFGYYGSNALDLETSNLFYKGGFYNDILKSETLNRMQNLNYFGGEYGVRILYDDPTSTLFDDAGFYVSYEQNRSAGLIFTEDLFKTVFEGNTTFQGDSAVLSYSEIAEYGYQKLSFGISQKGRITMGLGLLAFDSWNRLKVEQGTFYTSNSLDELRLDASGFYNQGVNPTGEAVGFGMSLDFEAVFPFDPSEDSVSTAKLVVGARNLGFFLSNKLHKSYSLDTTYLFNGFNLESLSDFQNSLVDVVTVQDSLAITPIEKISLAMLPFEVYFYAPSRANGKKVQLVYGFRYRNASGAIPQVYAGADWRPSSKTIISSYAFMGGYSFLKWGMSLRRQFGNLRLGILSNNILGFISTEAYSRSLGISMSYVFK